MRHLPIRARRLLLGGFLVYLFGILGFRGASHGHESAPGDPQSHSECQLCQITAHAYLAPQAPVCHESPAAPIRLAEAIRAPVLSERFRPFSSRAPPSV